MLYATFLEAIDDLGTDDDILDSLIDLLPKFFRKEIICLKGVCARGEVLME